MTSDNSGKSFPQKQNTSYLSLLFFVDILLYRPLHHWLKTRSILIYVKCTHNITWISNSPNPRIFKKTPKTNHFKFVFFMFSPVANWFSLVPSSGTFPWTANVVSWFQDWLKKGHINQGQWKTSRGCEKILAFFYPQLLKQWIYCLGAASASHEEPWAAERRYRSSAKP